MFAWKEENKQNKEAGDGPFKKVHFLIEINVFLHYYSDIILNDIWFDLT